MISPFAGVFQASSGHRAQPRYLHPADPMGSEGRYTMPALRPPGSSSGGGQQRPGWVDLLPKPL